MIETLPSGEEMTQRVTLVTDEFGRAVIDLRDEKFDAFLRRPLRDHHLPVLQWMEPHALA